MTDKNYEGKTILSLSPQFQAGRVLEKILPKISDSNNPVSQAPSLSDIIEELNYQTERLKKDDMSRVEETLLCQMQTLDSLFSFFLSQGLSQDWTPNMELLVNIALKAQRQTRATAETLGKIKNPQPYTSDYQACL